LNDSFSKAQLAFKFCLKFLNASLSLQQELFRNLVEVFAALSDLQEHLLGSLRLLEVLRDPVLEKLNLFLVVFRVKSVQVLHNVLALGD
jgi:hypothetical protein